jgi:integrase
VPRLDRVIQTVQHAAPAQARLGRPWTGVPGLRRRLAGVEHQPGSQERPRPGDFAWVTSHVFRKTAATELDRAGLSARQIADQLGHSKVSMTQDRYLGRRTAGKEAADALDRAHREGQKDTGEGVSAG